MKHIKLFENIEYDPIIKTIDNFNNMLDDLKPYIVYKYNMLAKDEDYEPDWDMKPTEIYEEDELIIFSAGHYKGQLIFDVVDFDHEGSIYNKYYVWLDPGEIEEIKMKMESDKYNL